MTPGGWQFWIDVGGTFTDCVARSPSGEVRVSKVLSSSRTLGRVCEVLSPASFRDSQRAGDPADFWCSYRIAFVDGNNGEERESRIESFDSETGVFQLADAVLMPGDIDAAYALSGGEEAPIFAIRWLLRLPREAAIPPSTIRLGTTRGTNALLTRTGAKTLFVTTAGFADVLEIGYQDRPRLFELAIRKPRPLYESVVEVAERLGADGKVLRSLDRDAVRESLRVFREQGVESVAVCLLHAYRNPEHEAAIKELAEGVGFADVSVSHEIAQRIGVVARGHTTVVDAYLNPVLRDYVHQLRRALRLSDLRLMTSAGTLVRAEHFVGKDSVLSGPAGGVVGFAHAAQSAGFQKAIGFDMGGTSTDVARFDGKFDYEFETEKAGVRIVAPMLAIETVAAGGGSVCGFDGVKLTVGPDSAGADPGPACYGRGGPLTITDMNVLLGRIPINEFPFPLDVVAIRDKLDELIAELRDAGYDETLSCEALAEGFLRIANANMVRAIRKISVAKGYDPREYALVSFGGAGGQHACAIADQLGMEHILVHPHAGILSAVGIGMADTKKFAERSVLRTWNDLAPAELDQLFAVLEQEGRRAIADDLGSVSRPLEVMRILELRYVGTDAAIAVPEPSDGDFVAAFERRYLQWFGFHRPGRAIEVVVARVEVTARATPPTMPQVDAAVGPARSKDMARMYCQQEWRDVPVFAAEHLGRGQRITGPAIVVAPTTTIVVDAGFEGDVMAHGELRLRRCERSETRSGIAREGASRPDPVSLEVFHNLFASIAEQMGATLERTAISVNVKERRDFSCAVFTADGDLVANAPHIPVHLGAMSETVKCILADHPDMAEGDVFVTNDPYRGGSHLPDVTVVTPIYDASSGQRLFFTASRAHHAEIGGITPGSMPPFSRSLAEEGVLIRSFKLMERGRSHEQELRRLLTSAKYPTRAVEDNLADIAAQVAANRRGALLLTELCDIHGREVVLSYMKHIQDAARWKMEQALAKLPDGAYEFTDHLDCGAPISARVIVEGQRATIRFDGTAPPLPNNLNANRSIVTAAVLYVLRCMIGEEIPLNAGVLEPVTIELPICLLNPPADADPAKCAAVVGGNVETSSRVVDVLVGALKLAAASQGTMNNLTFGDGTFGYYETIGGGAGALEGAAGADAVHTHMTNTRLTDPEVIEHRYPVQLVRFAIRRGSGGAGRWRGGHGITRRFRFLTELQVSLLTERRGPYAPFGLAGGANGALGVNLLFRRGIDQEVLPAKTTVQVRAGDELEIQTPGGGGWGTRLG